MNPCRFYGVGFFFLIPDKSDENSVRTSRTGQPFELKKEVVDDVAL